MAKIELRHLDCTVQKRYATVETTKLYSKYAVKLSIWDIETNKIISIILDKSTAIRLAKTLRTEINKIEE
tara:strand:+ start:5507 stop:5716 length:210 start_codon:yes stop_codon:yes gene_type:complete